MRGCISGLSAAARTVDRRHRAWLGRFLVLAICLTLLGTPLSTPAAEGFVWPQFGFDEQHSGVNPLETVLSPANVRSLTRLNQIPLVSASHPSVADGSPMFLSGVSIGGTARDVI